MSWLFKTRQFLVISHHLNVQHDKSNYFMTSKFKKETSFCYLLMESARLHRFKVTSGDYRLVTLWGCGTIRVR